jgi:hypothetical protein
MYVYFILFACKCRNNFSLVVPWEYYLSGIQAVVLREKGATKQDLPARTG